MKVFLVFSASTAVLCLANLPEREVAVTSISRQAAGGVLGGACWVNGTENCVAESIENCGGFCGDAVGNPSQYFCNIDREDEISRDTYPKVATNPTGGFSRGFGAFGYCVFAWDCNNTPCDLEELGYVCPDGDFIGGVIGTEYYPGWAEQSGCPTE